MEVEFKVKGCPFEDKDVLMTYMHAMDFASTLGEIRQQVRSRLKWGEGLTEQEVDFLEGLLELACIEGPEW